MTNQTGMATPRSRTHGGWATAWRLGLPAWCATITATLAAAGSPPDSISPGDKEAVVVVGDSCPTFSWTLDPSADGYEIVVFELVGHDVAHQAVEHLRRELPAGALAWTPSLDLCLEPGETYAWSVRARRAGREVTWSEPRLFETAPAPSQAELERALEVVRRHAETNSSEAGVTTHRDDTLPAMPRRVARPGAAPAAGNPLLKVGGAPVVTVRTLASVLCRTLVYRWVDRFDGTVLDCNTSKIWLKDASCLGSGVWNAGAGLGSVQEAVAALNAGADFGCAGYAPGTFTDWRLPGIDEYCSAGPDSGVCSAGLADLSLIDSSFQSPSVANGAGDGRWSEGDIFVGVASAGYWSGTVLQGAGTFAWGINLVDGQVVAGAQSNSVRAWAVRDGS
jgi:hypothetical protein